MYRGKEYFKLYFHVILNGHEEVVDDSQTNAEYLDVIRLTDAQEVTTQISFTPYLRRYRKYY